MTGPLTRFWEFFFTKIYARNVIIDLNTAIIQTWRVAETILDTVYACTQAMTMKRRTTGQLPVLARSNWNTVNEMSELDEDSLMEEKAAQLKILKHGEHQSHPLSLVR